MILDGYGLRDETHGNAIALANTPVVDKLKAECPFVKGYASGLAVGLPDGQMGNSEVGHLNMGAGRIVYQDLTKISKAIDDGDFFENAELLRACENAKANDSSLHLWGLVSDGGVHSHQEHLYGLLELDYVVARLIGERFVHLGIVRSVVEVGGIPAGRGAVEGQDDVFLVLCEIHHRLVLSDQQVIIVLGLEPSAVAAHIDDEHVGVGVVGLAVGMDLVAVADSHVGAVLNP